MKKAYAAMFAPFWNEIIKSLREEDFISNRLVERNLLVDNVSKILCIEAWRLCIIQPISFLFLFLCCKGVNKTSVCNKNLCKMTWWIMLYIFLPGFTYFDLLNIFSFIYSMLKDALSSFNYAFLFPSVNISFAVRKCKIMICCLFGF